MRNDINFKRKLWRTYIEGGMDYGSQVWSPTCNAKLSHLESVLRSYLANTEGLEVYNHWERLSMARLSSIQRRHERYKIMYIWKIVNGLVPNFGINWNENSRRGLMIEIPTLNSKVPDSVKTLRDLL